MIQLGTRPRNPLLAARATAEAAQQQADASQPDYGVLSSLAPPPDEPPGAAVAASPDDVPFRTCLKLPAERQEWLRDRAFRRIDEVSREMGRNSDGSVMPQTWMWIRQRNQDSYDGDFNWRLALGGVLLKSNFSLGTNKRHVRYLSARIQDDLLGTTPFVAALGRNHDRAELARQVEELVQGEIDRSTVRKALREAQKLALIRNEAVVKTSYIREATPFIGPARVLADPQGQPIMTPAKGLYVFEHDNTLPDPMTEGLSALEKDPSFQVKTDSPPKTMFVVGADGLVTQGTFQDFEDLPQENVQYEGVKCGTIDYRSFLCPLRVESTDAADINVHLYKETPERLKEQYSGIDVSQAYLTWYANIGQSMPVATQGEYDKVTSNVLKEITIAETYIRCDADADGREEEIYLVLDIDSRKVIFYDYLANVMKGRPFRSVPGIEQYPGRWYGVGIYSVNEDQELHIDVEFNRAQLKGSRDSYMLFRFRESVEEWQNGLPCVFGTDDVLNVNPGYDAINKPPVFKVDLTHENKNGLELMEISRQASDGLIGAISLKDASASDMNQSKTATGVVNLQQASDVITKATEQEQAEAITAIMVQVVDVVLENIDLQTLLLNKDATQIVTLNRDEIRSLQRDVRLVLTRSRSTQLLSSSAQAIEIGLKYRQLMQQDPEGARILRPLFVNQLKGLEINDADDICPEITDEMIQQWQQAQQNKTPQPQDRRNITIKYGEDLARSEQVQLLAQEGVKPADPNEMDQKRQADLLAKAQQDAARQQHRANPDTHGAA